MKELLGFAAGILSAVAIMVMTGALGAVYGFQLLAGVAGASIVRRWPRRRPRVYVHPADCGGPTAERFATECLLAAWANDWHLVDYPDAADLAIAPCLSRKLLRREREAPRLGTLVFHPSLLPLLRGPDALRTAVLRGDEVSGVTWFWATDELDAGPVCAQEPVFLPRGIGPREAYREIFMPAGLRALKRALGGIADGRPVRREQPHELATFAPRGGNPSANDTCTPTAA